MRECLPLSAQSSLEGEDAIYLPATSRPFMFLQKEACLSLCDVSTTHLTDFILNSDHPVTSTLKRRSLSQLSSIIGLYTMFSAPVPIFSRVVMTPLLWYTIKVSIMHTHLFAEAENLCIGVRSDHLKEFGGVQFEFLEGIMVMGPRNSNT